MGLIAVVYILLALIDNIIIYDNDFELHLTHIREILDRLRAAGLTANEAMMSKPVSQAPDFTKDYAIMSDASTVSVSGILLQREDDETSKLNVVSYASRKLLPHERSYSVIQLELLAIVFSIIKFHHYEY